MFDKMIKIEEGFQTSVNIAFDLTDDKKIREFIPTLSSIDIIEDILLSVNPSSTQRARILVGAYGRGKSHIILVLLSLLYKKDATLFANLLEKVKAYNEKLYDYIKEYLNSSRKLLPVVIGGSSASLTQSFMSALQKTLERENLQDVMPETHFAAAVNTIQVWKDKYADTYNSFVNSLNEPVSDFLLKLKSYDVVAYEKFVDLYPKLTAGSAFNPFVGFDVVEIYEKVNDKLVQRGYDGLFIVYDEFSKYLESSISNASISDIKLLQDFAEKCNRSAYKQMHLLLICHKDISNYIDSNLPKEKVDGWRGVSGRFKHVDLQNNFSQIYEIIEAVIKKEPNAWEKYVKANKETFKDLINRMLSLGIFSSNNFEEVASIILGCYPLHPISVFILPRISEKIAQNERTLFTFLSADEKNSLSAFLKQSPNDSVSFLSADVMYDYFEPLLRKEVYTSDTHKIYKLAATVLQKVEQNSLESRIIKLLALIYIISQFEKMPPTVNVVVEAFKDCVRDPKEIHVALNNLLQRDCIVYLKRSNNYLKLKESSGVDVPKEIEKQSALLKATVSAVDILNDSCYDNYIYPTRYNDEHDITRYFDFSFIAAEKILSRTFDIGQTFKNGNADGVILAIVPKSPEELEKVRKYIVDGAIKDDRALLVLPTSFVSIEEIAYEFAAVKKLKELAHDDDILSDEYSVYIEDLEEVVNNFINLFLRPETHKAEYYLAGDRKQLNRKAQLSALLSDICEKAFPYTPIINNESINKNYLPSVAVNSRGKILNGILAIPLEKNLGLAGTGQDVSIMRSVLISPIKQLCALSKEYDCTNIIDMCQSAGIVDVELASDNYDYAVFDGHKTLYGPFGVAGIIGKPMDLFDPIIVGGTGVDSLNQEMPSSLPERFEAGSHNIVAIAGLNAAIKWINSIGVNNLYAKEKQNHRKLIEILLNHSNIDIKSPLSNEKSVGIVSCVFRGYSSDSIGNVLSKNDIAVRTGLHCAPLAHKTLGTLPAGTVRFSTSWFTSEADFNELDNVLSYIEENS